MVAVLDGDGSMRAAFPSGTKVVHADDLEGLAAEPDQQLLAGQLGPSLPYALRLQALFLRHAYRHDPASGLSNARIEPQLHQLYAAHRVANKLQPRMIFADEVGLGKTIEAGLVIKELRARGFASRVLVVCPAGLLYQWQHELASKFNETFEIYDGVAVKQYGKGGVNPWTKHDSVIASIPFAANPKHVDRIVEAGWDLVVFDEAHRVRRSQQGNKVSTTQAYRLADELKELVDGVLLLTATPMQLHPFELYSLVELVEPGLFPRVEVFDLKRKRLPKLNHLMRAIQGWTTLTDIEHQEVITEHAALLREAGLDSSRLLAELGDASARAAALDALAAQHPLADVMVRNRKAEIGGFAGREAVTVMIPLEDRIEEQALYEEISAYIQFQYDKAILNKNRVVGFLMVTYQKLLASSSTAIRRSFERRIVKLRKLRSGELPEKKAKVPSAGRLDEVREAGEYADNLFEEIEGSVIDHDELDREIALLEHLAELLAQSRDVKAARLVDLAKSVLDENPEEKLLVFTQFVDTQEFLVHVLEQNGYTTASFNGKMSLDEKEAAVARFRDDVQILISTEAGGEGRNFQFCHLMVNYDLPWNPMKVEQRIGRLDRIGQKHTVRIYNLACQGTVEERVLEVLGSRIGLFEESVGSLDPILGEIEQDLERVIMGQYEGFASAEAFEEDLERRVLEARAGEETLADFALDRSSFRRDIANSLFARRPLATAEDLEQYVADTLPYYGGSLTEHAEGGSLVTLSRKLQARMRTRHKVLRGVFDPVVARELEQLDFLAFGHEFVDAIVDLPIAFDPVTVSARRLEGAPLGTSLEFFWEVATEGLRPFGKLCRHVVGPDLAVSVEELSEIPPLGGEVEVREVPAPDWVHAALAASEEVAQQAFSDERARATVDAAVERDEQLARAQRIFDYRRVRHERRIADDEAWIRDKELGGSERDKKILPARRGKLDKERQRLEGLEAEYQQQVLEIEARLPATTRTLLAAGVVLGP